jgi:hypothetical protein
MLAWPLPIVKNGTMRFVLTLLLLGSFARAQAPCVLGTSCPAQAVSWTVGATCNATTTATPHGALATVTDSTAPTQGSANFSCFSGNYSASPIAGATCVSVVLPTSLSLTHTPGSRNFTVSWTAGSNNGTCKLQYYRDGTTWTDLSGTYNCDATVTNSAASLPSTDAWTSVFNGTGVSIRLVAVADSTPKGTFPQNTTCTTGTATNFRTPTIDEDCNTYWDNGVVNSSTDAYYISTNVACHGTGSGLTVTCPTTCAEDLDNNGSADPLGLQVPYQTGAWTVVTYTAANNCTGATSTLSEGSWYYHTTLTSSPLTLTTMPNLHFGWVGGSFTTGSPNLMTGTPSINYTSYATASAQHGNKNAGLLNLGTCVVLSASTSTRATGTAIAPSVLCAYSVTDQVLFY